MFPILFAIGGYIIGCAIKDAIDYSQRRGQYEQLHEPKNTTVGSLTYQKEDDLAIIGSDVMEEVYQDSF